MKNSHILLLCILGAALLSSVLCNNGNTPDDCCFSFYPRRLNKNLVRQYDLTDDRCSRRGVILITKKSHRICADPGLTWVENIVKSLDDSNF